MYFVYNLDSLDTLNTIYHEPLDNKNTRKFYSHMVYDEKYENVNDFIKKQRDHMKTSIIYPFEWYDIETNTDLNIDMFNKYEIMNFRR